jgi:hypothetical protein
MDAQQVRITLHDESGGYEISPDRVPLAVLRSFTHDINELLGGDKSDMDTSQLDVAVIKGSLGVLTAPINHASLLRDLAQLKASEFLDAVSEKRRAVIERWQKKAKKTPGIRFEISTSQSPEPIVISAHSDYRADDADQWVRVERYLRGEIYDLGGAKAVNAHIRLPDGKTLSVDARREVLRDDKVNRLYKPAMVRITAEYNVATREYRNAQLIEFVEHAQSLDEQEFKKLTQRGEAAWKDVPSATGWVESLRGHKA